MPAAVAPPRRPGRLDSLSRPSARPPKPTPRAPPPQKTCCENPKIEDNDEGGKTCKSCFMVISESNIVSDVTFQEDSRGAAAVQGGFVGENARFAKSSMGSGAFQRVGGGERKSSAESEANGRRLLASLCPRLHLPDSIFTQANHIWSLALGIQFSAGRKMDEVIAACLYAACRRQKENTILLMDISEINRVNVFRLGEVYKDLVKELFLADHEVGFQNLVEVEPLILKYCRKLEFGEATKQVAEDAIKIVRRMKRDWMVTGRHPAGLCGACIILAARMNNFRRTVREIVYVSKVADVTVAKRVEEFRRTKSAALTVDQFRLVGNRIKFQHDPPAIYESEIKRKKFEEMKRLRQVQGDPTEPIEIPDDASSRASSVALTPPPTQTESEEDARSKRQRTDTGHTITAPIQQQPRYDTDGFAIPALPTEMAIDPAITGQTAPLKRKRGRPRKDERPPPLPISEEELAEERELEDSIEEVLEDPQIVGARNEIEEAKAQERARLLAEQQRVVAAERSQARREKEGIDWYKDKATGDGEVIDAELAAEFADDPEVLNCLLSPQETSQKEKIWLTHNEDWLRSQYEKELVKKIAEAAGGREKAKRGAKGGKKRKRGKMGDGTLLTEAGTPIETPADANAAMLAKRAPAAFSKFVNYDALSRVYGGSPSTSASRAGSEAPTVNGSSTASPSREQTPASASERSSVTPAPPVRSGLGLQSPPSTQHVTARIPTTPSQAAVSRPHVLASPAATQAPAALGAEKGEYPVPDDEDEEMEDEEEENEYRSEPGTPREFYDDEREDIGEDDYNRAIDTMGGAAMGEFGDDDEY